MVVIILLGLIYLSGLRIYINSNNPILYSTINFVIVSVVMIIIPLVIYIVKKKKLEYEYGKKVCLYNSIGMFIISVLLQAFAGIGIIGGLGAIFYYYINMILFVSKKENYTTKKEKAKIKKETHKKEKKPTNTKIIITISALSFSILLNATLGCLFLLDHKELSTQNKKYKNEIKQMENKLDASENELESVSNSLFSILGGRSTGYIINKLNSYDQNIAFIVEGYGNYWFDYDCLQQVVKGSYSYWAYNKEQAIDMGYVKYICQ